jgi:serine protease Do
MAVAAMVMLWGQAHAASPAVPAGPTSPPSASKPEAPSVLKQLDDAFVHVAEKVTPAVVNISSSKKESPGMSGQEMEPFFKNHPFREFFGDEFFKKFRKSPKEEGGGFRQQGMGSGVIVSADGFILTNAHVVKDADEIKVNLSDKRSFTAKVIGADTESDIAVIKIDGSNLPIARLGDSSELRVGEIVLAVGNPFGLNRTVTSGIVSATGRSNVGIIDYEDFIQTDAAINPGNSGGPLVNIQGEVIGINTAIASRSGGYQGIGFAIPISSAKMIMEELRDTGKVRRGLLGVNIQDITEPLAKSFGRADFEGALVSQVVDGSPADKAGIQQGDIILKFNGQQVTGASNLKNMVGKEKPGSSATLTVFRSGKTFDISLTIGERNPKKIAAASQKGGSGDTSNELGVDVERLSGAQAEQMGLKEGVGVRVRDLDPEGAAGKMGLKPGDVILEIDGKPIKEIAEFNAAIKQAREKKLIRLQYQRDKDKFYVAGPVE